ncbi:hypothetical protein EMMF5_001273 [Cystobasidiomycetes sp. EMM_F5]
MASSNGNATYATLVEELKRHGSLQALLKHHRDQQRMMKVLPMIRRAIKDEKCKRDTEVRLAQRIVPDRNRGAQMHMVANLLTSARVKSEEYAYSVKKQRRAVARRNAEQAEMRAEEQRMREINLLVGQLAISIRPSVIVWRTTLHDNYTFTPPEGTNIALHGTYSRIGRPLVVGRGCRIDWVIDGHRLATGETPDRVTLLSIGQSVQISANRVYGSGTILVLPPGTSYSREN